MRYREIVSGMKPAFKYGAAKIYQGDCLDVLGKLPESSVHCCVTSPPYWGLRNYGQPGQLGLEATPDEYVENMVKVFQAVKRVLRPDGTLWLNLGDSYTSGGRKGHGNLASSKQRSNGHMAKVARRETPPGLKPKDLVGVPWRVALALQADGWYLRRDIVWHKPNAMPESAADRPSGSHEYVFLLAKAPSYYYDGEAVRVKGPGSNPRGKNPKHASERSDATSESLRNHVDNPNGASLRSVWTISTANDRAAHFATFPPKLVKPCVKAGTSEKGVCSECGAPWVRIVERERVPTRPGKDTKVTGDSLVDGNRDPERHVTIVRTVDWRPGCSCDANKAPAVVLDPFSGSGTTAAVAGRLGRASIGIELNPEYIDIARDKIRRAIKKRGLGLT